MAVKTNPKAAKSDRDRLRAFHARQENFERQRSRRTRDNRRWGLIAAAVVVVAIGAQVGFSLTNGSTPNPSASAHSNSLADKSLAQGKTWNSTLSINGIALSVSLDGAAAPQAVSSTIQLANEGFYNGLSCHRLTTSGIYVLQCGDPKGDGTGGPGYSYGPIENAPTDDVYPVGTIAMARQGGNGDSQGSQFFIVYAESTIPSDSAGGYTVIGKVKSGLDKLIPSVIVKGVAAGTETPVVPTAIDFFTIAQK